MPRFGLRELSDTLLAWSPEAVFPRPTGRNRGVLCRERRKQYKDQPACGPSSSADIHGLWWPARLGPPQLTGSARMGFE